MSYYKRQLKKLKSFNGVNISLVDLDNNKTHWMSLNLDSIKALENFLNKYKKVLKSEQKTSDENNNKGE